MALVPHVSDDRFKYSTNTVIPAVRTHSHTSSVSSMEAETHFGCGGGTIARSGPHFGSKRKSRSSVQTISPVSSIIKADPNLCQESLLPEYSSRQPLLALPHPTAMFIVIIKKPLVMPSLVVLFDECSTTYIIWIEPCHIPRSVHYRHPTFKDRPVPVPTLPTSPSNS